MELADFLSHLERSQILAAIDLSACHQWADRQPDLSAEELGRHLLRSGKLSRYQKKSLLAGRSAGFVLGSYEIVAVLGKGGMAAVYLARDHEQNRLVALKTVTKEQVEAKPGYLHRLQRELHFGRRLTHPGIVQAYELREFPQAHCLAIEYVPGMDLYRRVKRYGTFAPIEAVRIVGQVALALDEVHRRGVVHTDLKPGNVILCLFSGGEPGRRKSTHRPVEAPVLPQPPIKIIDFGLAIDLDLDEPAPPDPERPAGHISGTFGYAAPEQTRSREKVGPSADIFALGSMLFYLITGETPFSGENTREKIHRIRHQEPPWYLLPAGLPPGLRQLMQELLAKKPRSRPRTAAIVADALIGMGRLAV